jgi:recombination protein RecA
MGAGVSVIPTGSMALDVALGIGGIPRGRIVEVFGPEGSGKTTVCLHIIAEAQRAGGIAIFIDAEHALDPTYARTLGVNIDELLVSQPDNGEQALEIADMMVRSGAVDLVVIDSVAALVPRAEIEGEMGDSHVGLQARLMSQAMRKLAGSLSRFDTTAIFINQLREKIGVMFGSPETTPGGRALKFYSSVRLDIRKIDNLKDGVEAVGSRVRVKVVKNKLAPPFRQAEFDILYGQGISKEGSLIDVGVAMEIVKKSVVHVRGGSAWSGQGERSELPEGAPRDRPGHRAADPGGGGLERVRRRRRRADRGPGRHRRARRGIGQLRGRGWSVPGGPAPRAPAPRIRARRPGAMDPSVRTAPPRIGHSGSLVSAGAAARSCGCASPGWASTARRSTARSPIWSASGWSMTTGSRVRW